MAEDLTKKLEGIILDLKNLMKQRKDRIETLRAEIDEIEASNESLEKEIQSMLSYF
jgi:cell division protein FtsB